MYLRFAYLFAFLGIFSIPSPSFAQSAADCSGDGYDAVFELEVTAEKWTILENNEVDPSKKVEVDAMMYDGTIPGTKITVTTGDKVCVAVTNSMSHDTSVHFHGINVNADGSSHYLSLDLPMTVAPSERTMKRTAQARKVPPKSRTRKVPPKSRGSRRGSIGILLTRRNCRDLGGSIGTDSTCGWVTHDCTPPNYIGAHVGSRRNSAALCHPELPLASTGRTESRFETPPPLREWQPLAVQGDSRAQYNLGVMYDKGRGMVLMHALSVAVPNGGTRWST